MQTEPSQSILRQAEDCFRQADYDQTLAILVRGFTADTEFRPFYTLAAQTLEVTKAQEEAMLFWNALEHFEDWEPFFKLGYHFIDVWQYEMAKPFLEKSYRLDPSNPDGAHELALCYANTFDMPKAIELLESFDNHDFWTVYRLHRYWLLTNKPSPIPEYVEESLYKLSQIEKDEEAIPQAFNLLHELQSMYHRYKQLPAQLSEPLKAWQFVQYGTALIDIAPNNSQAGTGGRYLQYEGSYQNIASVLQKAVDYLEMTRCEVNKVVFLETPEDAVIGWALAYMLNIRAEEADGENMLHPNTLIVAADNKTFNGEHDLWEVQSNQLVFALKVNWLQPSMICPDLVGLLCKKVLFPWKIESPNISLKKIAEKLANTTITPPSKDWIRLYEPLTTYLLGGEHSYQQRPTFRVESPISGVYL